jgi:hypothetical protein
MVVPQDGDAEETRQQRFDSSAVPSYGLAVFDVQRQDATSAADTNPLQDATRPSDTNQLQDVATPPQDSSCCAPYGIAPPDAGDQ